MANDSTVKIGVDFSADDIKRGYKTIQDEGKKTANSLKSVNRGYSATLFKRKLRAKAWKRAQNRLYNLIETRKYGESMVHS